MAQTSSAAARSLDSLKAVLLKAEGFCRENGHPQAAQQLRALGDKAAAEVVQVVVMGEFKRGKSTLINALVGRAVLPMDVVPLTAVVTAVRRAERESATVEYLDGRAEDVPLEKIGGFVTERHNPKNDKKVDRVVVGLPTAFVPEGLLLVDTPGVGSVYRHNTETAQRCLPKADAVILVLAADPPISQAEVDFLHSVRRWASKLYVVLNKTDYLSEEDLPRVIDFTGKTVRNALGGAGSIVHALSAKRALEPSARADSGIEGIAAALERLAVAERRGVVLASAHRGAQDILTAMGLGYELEAKACGAAAGELDARVADLRKSLENIRRRQYEAEKLFSVELKDHVAAMEEALYLYARKEAGRIRSVLESVHGGAKKLSSAELRKKLNDSLLEAVEDSYSEYLANEESSWAAAFRSMSDRYLETTLALANQALKDAAGAFGVQERALEKPAIEVTPPAVWFILEEVSPWSFGFFPLPTLRMFKPFFWKAVKDKVWEAMDVNAGRMRYDYSRRVEAAGEAVRTSIQGFFGSAVSDIQNAVAAAEARKDESEEGLRRRMAQLAEKRRKFDRLLADLDDV